MNHWHPRAVNDWAMVVAIMMVFWIGNAVVLAQTTNIAPSGLNTRVANPTANPNITGGTRPGGAAGTNLFHSFGEFNIGTNNVATFLNSGSIDLAGNPLASGLPTSNILGRVTGGNPSNIFGTIDTMNFGSANLYLINPAGVLFGPTASLNIGGSFTASTADYIKMTDGAKFYANPSQPTVLSIAPVAAFGFLSGNPAAIAVQGGTLSVQTGQSLSLVGGNITLVGGTLRAPDGEITLASAASSGEIIPNVIPPAGEHDFQNQDFDIDSFSQLGQIQLSQASLDINAIGASQRDITGGILIKADHLSMDTSSILAQNPAGRLGASVNVFVNSLNANDSNFSVSGGGVTGAIHIQGSKTSPSNFSPAETLILNNSSITAESDREDGGAITLFGNTLHLTNNRISTAGGGSLAPGFPSLGGFINLYGQSITIQGGTVSTSTSGEARAGDIFLQTDHLVATGATLSSASTGTACTVCGSAGAINIYSGISNASPLDILLTGSTISTDGNNASAGNIRVEALRDITLIDSTISSRVTGTPTFLFPANIILKAPSVSLKGVFDGSQVKGSEIRSDTNGAAQAGDITLNVGTLTTENSKISTSSSSRDETAGNAGNITIQGIAGAGSAADTVSLVAGPTIATDIFGGSAARASGNISITAHTIALGSAAISADTISAASAGNITLNVGTLTAEFHSAIDSQSGTRLDIAETGNAGSITIQGITGTDSSAASVSLDNSIISTRIFEGGAASAVPGNISITADTLALANFADIESNSFGAAPAGNITLNVGTLTASIFSIISSTSSPAGILLDSVAGKAGSITIQGITGSGSSAASVTLDNSTISTTIDGGNSSTEAATIDIMTHSVNLTNDAQIAADTTGAAPAGKIIITSPSVLLGEGSALQTTSSGVGKAGDIILEGQVLQLQSGSGLNSSTSGTGQGGAITLNAPSITVNASSIKTDAQETGDAGAIQISVSNLTMDADSQISSSTSGTGTGGSINLNNSGSSSLTVTGGTLVGQSATNSTAGQIDLNSTSDLQLTGTTLSVQNTGTGNAGPINIASGGNLTIRNGVITTQSAEGSGGNIKLTAPNLIRIVDSTITSSVQGEAGTADGGNINIDPQIVVIQNSNIFAKANAGAGGNINIAALGAVLIDPNSDVNASAVSGVSGSININSPIQVLSGALVPMKLAYTQTGLSSDRCAADPKGQFSSFVQTGRDGAPQTPGGLASSPLGFLDTFQTSSLDTDWTITQIARLGLSDKSGGSANGVRFFSDCRS